MFRVLRAACIGAAFLAPFGASAAILNFDALDSTAGQPIPLLSFSEAGYTFALSFTGNNKGPAIFDTTCFGYSAICNGDLDLVPAVQGENGVGGNVMILQDNTGPTPNDSAAGGTITFKLTSGPSFFLTGFSGVDEQAITAFDKDGTTVLGVIDLANDSDTGRVTFKSSRINVGDSFVFKFAGSGGIDSLVVAPIPVPAALPLSLAALGALGWVSRRRA